MSEQCGGHGTRSFEWIDKRRSRNHISHVCTFLPAPFRRSCLWLLARCRRTPGLPKAGVIPLTCQQMYHRELDHQAHILNPIIQTVLATHPF